MRRLIMAWLVGLLAATTLGACGGDEDKDVDAVQAADVSDEADSSTDAGDEQDDGDDGSTGSIGAFSAARCAEAIQAYSAGAASAAQAMSGDTKAMKASIAQMEKFADEAPREIRDDLQTMSKAWTAYVTGIAESGWDPQSGKPPTEEQTKQLDEATKVFDDEEYVEAQDAIDDWFASDCTAG